MHQAKVVSQRFKLFAALKLTMTIIIIIIIIMIIDTK